MLLSREESERRLTSPRNLLNVLPRDNSAVVQLHKTNGRGAAIPQSLKVIASVLAKTEPHQEIKDALNIKTIGSKNPDVVSAVERTTERIRDMALERLMLSLGIINDETLSNCGAKDAAIVARNLAGVVEKLTPKDLQGQSGVTLVVYAPQQRSEKHYETIDVKAIPQLGASR